MAGGYDWYPGRARNPNPGGFGNRAGGGPHGRPGAPTSGASGSGEETLGRNPAPSEDDEVVDAEIVGDEAGDAARGDQSRGQRSVRCRRSVDRRARRA